MFRRCLVLLIMFVTTSSFAPSLTNPSRSDRADGGRPKHRTTSSSSLSATEEESSNFQRCIHNEEHHPDITSLLAIGREVLATFMIFGALLSVSPNPATATTQDFHTQSTRTVAESKTTTTSSMLSNSFLTISDNVFNPNDLRIQPKYLDLAGDLKEELKFRAQQGKEKAQEKAQEIREKQQAAADIRDAKNKEYDDMFDQAEKERNEYYSKRVITKETYVQALKDQEPKRDGNAAYNKAMQAFDPEAGPVEGLKFNLELNLEEQNRLKTALAENRLKDQDDRDVKVERTLLKIKIEKADQEASKIRKDIGLEESLEVIKLQRQSEVKVYQDRGAVREREKQDQIEKIRIIKEREKVAFEEIRAAKKQQVEDLKFDNEQIMFDRRFDDLDRFEERKEVLATKAKQEDKARLKSLRNDLNQLSVEGTANTAAAATTTTTNVPGQQQQQQQQTPK